MYPGYRIRIRHFYNPNISNVPQSFYLTTRWNNDPIMVDGRRRWRIRYFFLKSHEHADGTHDNEQKQLIRDSLKFIEVTVSKIDV